MAVGAHRAVISLINGNLLDKIKRYMEIRLAALKASETQADPRVDRANNESVTKKESPDLGYSNACDASPRRLTIEKMCDKCGRHTADGARTDATT